MKGAEKRRGEGRRGKERGGEERRGKRKEKIQGQHSANRKTEGLDYNRDFQKFSFFCKETRSARFLSVCM